MLVVVVVVVAVAAKLVDLLPAPSLEGIGSTAVGAMMRDVLGDRRTALVRFGSARRETAAGRGFCVCAPSAMSLTSAGVGVSGTPSSFLLRFFRGVDGAFSVSSAAGACVTAFRFLDAAGGAGGGAGSTVAALVTREANRADLRDAMFWASV